ncbi:MAG: CopG family transcriptional regulator [Spirochaetales bacterium]|nr:CopG family transcriptional regulator [Spirochaetales bacterium]
MPDFGEKDGGDMSKKMIYRDAPKAVAEAINAAKVVDDFLPPPEELLLRNETVKVTISLTQTSVDFFKKSAEEQGVPYQAMIRKVLDLYSQRYQRE